LFIVGSFTDHHIPPKSERDLRPLPVGQRGRRSRSERGGRLPSLPAGPCPLCGQSWRSRRPPLGGWATPLL